MLFLQGKKKKYDVDQIAQAVKAASIRIATLCGATPKSLR